MATETQTKNVSINNFEQCLKCSICTVYCPVSAVSPAYPGPKQAGPDAERYRLKNKEFFDEALKMCLNCKRCEVACPSGVNIGDIIQAARIKYNSHRPKLRDMMLANTDFVGTMASPFASIANPVLKLKPVKAVLHGVMAIDKHRTFPDYSSRKFESWFKKEVAATQENYSKHVSYFHGCYVNYNYPQLGKDFVKIMNAVGYGVHLLEKEKCCGVALIANGMPKQARRQGEVNMASMRKAIAQGHQVLTTSSTCTFTIRDEYNFVLGLDNHDVRDKISLATRFIYKKIEDGELILPPVKPDFKLRIAYHSACHMEKLGWSFYSSSLLRMIPGVQLIMLDSLCCGMAGTYGFKTENYRRSLKIGEPLFQAIREAEADVVVTDCEMCKQQIEAATGARVLHPIEVLAMALDD